MVAGRRFEWEERAVVADLAFPVTVEVVCHDVQKIDILDDFWHIVTGRDGFRAGRHGGS